MGQRKNRVKICQRIFINNCQLTLFCRCNEISEMFRSGLEEQKPMPEWIKRQCWFMNWFGLVVAEVFEEQQLDSGDLVLAMQLLVVSGRRRSRMRRKFTGWCGRLWIGKLRRRTVLIRLIGSNGVICCWCWQDTLPTLVATWRLCNLRACNHRTTREGNHIRGSTKAFFLGVMKGNQWTSG